MVVIVCTGEIVFVVMMVMEVMVVMVLMVCTGETIFMGMLVIVVMVIMLGTG